MLISSNQNIIHKLDKKEISEWPATNLREQA